MTYTFAIGDIHGCLARLEAMLGKIERSRPTGGTVVFLGDYVDRGPNSRGVIGLVMGGPRNDKWKWVALKGNHEAMMVSCIRGEDPISWWLGNGGHETMSSYEFAPDPADRRIPEEHLNWAAALPEKHEDRYRIFVHAGVDETIPLEDQSSQDLLWKRFPPHWSGTYWGKHLVHGHTPDPENPMTIGNRTNVDSACVFGGKLSCAVFADDQPGGPLEFISV